MVTSSKVPWQFPVAIDGRPYMVVYDQHEDATIPSMREQADSSTEATGGSLSRLSFWRRDQTSWHLGAGQKFFDRPGSERERFLSSVGIDVFTEGQLSLSREFEKDSHETLPSPTKTLQCIGVGDYLIGLRLTGTGFALYRTGWDDAAWVQVGSAFPADTYANRNNVIATDGDDVYVATAFTLRRYQDISAVAPGSNDVYATNSVSGSSIINRVAYVKGRLMVQFGSGVYNLTVQGVDLPTYTANDLAQARPRSINWYAWGAGPSSILLGGGQLTKAGSIWRATIRDDGSGLSQFVQVVEMQLGEFPLQIISYMGVLVIATNRGVRLGLENGDGQVDTFSLIELGYVAFIAIQNDYVWWVAFDQPYASQFRVGRISLADFVATGGRGIRPGYAIEHVVSNTPSPVGLVVDSRGVAVPTHTNVWRKRFDLQRYQASGTITMSAIGYQAVERKSFEYVSVSCAKIPPGCTVEVSFSVDGLASTVIGTLAEGATGQAFSIIEAGATYVGRLGTVSLRLTGPGTATPVVNDVTLFAIPLTMEGEQFKLPLAVTEQVTDLQGGVHYYDPQGEYEYLKGLKDARAPVDVQVYGGTYRAKIDSISRGPGLHGTQDGSSVQGVYNVVCRELTISN